MVEPHLDQLFGNGERNQPLRRLARNPHGGGDLVLRAAGNVIEPTRPRRVVQPSRSIGSLCHLASTAQNKPVLYRVK